MRLKVEIDVDDEVFTPGVIADLISSPDEHDVSRYAAVLLARPALRNVWAMMSIAPVLDEAVIAEAAHRLRDAARPVLQEAARAAFSEAREDIASVCAGGDRPLCPMASQIAISAFRLIHSHLRDFGPEHDKVFRRREIAAEAMAWVSDGEGFAECFEDGVDYGSAVSWMRDDDNEAGT